MEKKERLIFVCISLIYILSKSNFFFFMGSNSYFVAINILIIFIVMFINGLEH